MLSKKSIDDALHDITISDWRNCTDGFLLRKIMLKYHFATRRASHSELKNTNQSNDYLQLVGAKMVGRVFNEFYRVHKIKLYICFWTCTSGYCRMVPVSMYRWAGISTVTGPDQPEIEVGVRYGKKVFRYQAAVAKLEQFQGVGYMVKLVMSCFDILIQLEWRRRRLVHGTRH